MKRLSICWSDSDPWVVTCRHWEIDGMLLVVTTPDYGCTYYPLFTIESFREVSE